MNSGNRDCEILVVGISLVLTNQADKNPRPLRSPRVCETLDQGSLNGRDLGRRALQSRRQLNRWEGIYFADEREVPLIELMVMVS